jgi:WD40 repeat protein
MNTKYVVQCVVCGHRMRVQEEHIGLTGQCGKCGNAVAITQDSVTLSTRSGSQTSSTTDSASGEVVNEKLDWKSGEILLDIYEVLSVLGEGGMGKVYRVRHRLWNIDLAVKSPRPSLLAKTKGGEHFERECETWINLGLHPNIVSCYYVRRIDQIPRIFAEFVEGGTLWQWILAKKFLADNQRTSVERILRVAIQIAWGLHHAHSQGLIHRDVKPGNVLMTLDGNAKVTDFGLAITREVTSDLPGGSGSATVSAGGMTPMYCSPEQAAREKISFKSDVWSFGLCVLQMFTRKIVWPSGQEAVKGLEYHLAKGQREENALKIPDEIVQVLIQCFQKDPAKRPASMMDIATRLAEIYRALLGTPFPLQPPKTTEAMAHSLNNRAVSLIDLGKSNEALQHWQKALQGETQHTQSTFNLGLIRWRTARISDDVLIKKMQEVSHLHPHDPVPLYLQAQIHLERGDCVSTLQISDELQKSHPNYNDIKAVHATAQQHVKDSRRLLYSFDAHADAANTVIIANDGDRVYSGSEDNTIKQWSMSQKDCVRVLHGHTGSVEGLSLSADGRILLSLSRDRTMRLWNTASGACIETIEGQRDGVQAACISPDGIKILSRGADDTAIVYDTERIERTHTLEGHIDFVTGVRWSRDMQHVYTSSQDGTLRKWDMYRAQCVQIFEGHQGPVTCLDLSADGSLLISGGADKSLRVWHTSTGQCLRVLVGHRHIVRSVSISDDGTACLSGSNDGTVRLWLVDSGRCIRTYDQHQDEVRSVSISRDGQFGVSVSRDKTLKHWKLTTPISSYLAPYALCKALRSEAVLTSELHFTEAMSKARATLKEGDLQAAAQCIRIARDQTGFARNPEAIRLWNRMYLGLPKERLNGVWEAGRFVGHSGAVFSLSLSADGRWLATAGGDGTIRMWETGTAKCVRTLTGHGAAVKSISMTGDARFLMSGSEDQTILLWDMSSGEVIRNFETQMGSVECVGLSPDGLWAVSGGWEFRLYEVATGRPLRVFEGHSADVTAVAWSPDCRYVLSASSDESIRMWEVATGNCVNVFQGSGGAFKSVAIGLSGGIAVGGTGHLFGRAGKIHVWDTASGAKLSTIEDHTGSISGVALSSDGRFLVSAGSDSTLRIHDLAEHTCIKVIQGHEGAVEDVRISMDGRFAATAGIDGMVKTWALDWDLGTAGEEEWDPAAGVYIDHFLTVHTPYAAELKPNVQPDLGLLNQALARKGKPIWNEVDFAQLLHTLGCAGFGWIAPDVVERELERMASRRTGITSIFRRSGR